MNPARVLRDEPHSGGQFKAMIYGAAFSLCPNA